MALPTHMNRNMSRKKRATDRCPLYAKSIQAATLSVDYSELIGYNFRQKIPFLRGRTVPVYVNAYDGR